MGFNEIDTFRHLWFFSTARYSSKRPGVVGKKLTCKIEIVHPIMSVLYE